MASNASFFAVISEVAQAVGNICNDLDDLFPTVELRLKDLSENLVYVIWITSLDSDFEGFLVVFDLKQEWNFFNNLLFVFDKVITETLFSSVVGKLCKFGEVYAELDLTQNDVVVHATSYRLAHSCPLGLKLLLLASGSFNVRERYSLIDRQLARKLIKLLFKDSLQLTAGLRGMLEHLSAPILVDHAQIL